ncbi:MAG: cell division protein ZapA [Muribaculaceae bacterium]|nr:cell division protein ZapA [Muribaculaceae bacterium]
MATTRDNVTIEIIIAGEPIKLLVPFDQQDKVRECERQVNALYSDWRARFPRKTPFELLAMIAYQYASYYQEMTERYDRITESLRLTSESLDDILESVSE